MKYLLVLLSSLSVITSSAGIASISILNNKDTTNKDKNQKNEPNTNEPNDPNTNEPNTNEPNEPNTNEPSKPTKKSLTEDVKITNIQEIHFNWEPDDTVTRNRKILENLYKLNVKLNISQVKIDNFVDDDKNGSFLLTVIEDSSYYEQESINITYQKFVYNPVEFELSDYEISLYPDENKSVSIINYSEDWPDELLPEIFNYNTNYLNVEFIKENHTIRIKSIIGDGNPPNDGVDITVKSNDRKCLKTIHVTLKAKKVNFKLDKNGVSLKGIKGQQAIINVLNYNEIINKDDLPTEFDYDGNGSIKVNYEEPGKIVITTTGVIFEEQITLIAKSKSNTSSIISVNLLYDVVSPTYDKTNINMEINSVAYINITNYNKLLVNKNLPKNLVVSDSSSFSAILEGSKIKITSKDKVSYGTLTIWTDALTSSYAETILVNVQAPSVKFQIKDNINISMNVFEETTIDVLNWKELYNADKNIPSSFKDSNGDDINKSGKLAIYYKRDEGKIHIKAMDKAVYNFGIWISSNYIENNKTYEKLVKVSINIPDVTFDVESPKDMLVNSQQTIKIKNFSSLIHENNYPSEFSYSVNGVIKAELSLDKQAIVIYSIDGRYCENFELTIYSKNKKHSTKFKFDVIKKFNLNDLNKSLGNMSDREDNSIRDKFYDINKNLGLSKEIFDGIEISNKTYLGATLEAKTSLSKKWFLNSVQVEYYFPIKNNHDVTTDWNPDDYSNKNQAKNTAKVNDTRTVDISLSDLQRVYSKVKINVDIEYKWTNEYTGKWENNIRGSKSENLTLEYDIKDIDKTQFAYRDETFNDGKVKNEVLFYFYIAIKYSSTENVKTNYKIDLETVAQMDRYNTSWYDAYKLLAVSKISLKNVEFEKV
ncbi:hypothetical protein SGLAD_v1c01930 [Spiroplasma gladiatoris]|uniref:Uncharacterized protein n=1 Tax=Spiroplasma gladiatoris TaxID=2143 RepID=A0A4P7AGW4_9MOLU|nr:hypothetical protein [Spiroplasma gladiatoris]QBQ07392.1 hypothetical protein SGLAD_v1c01930 [Spiroplasma gladiatoris]